MSYVTVRIDTDDMLSMLLDRCEAWGTSSENIDLFEKMYENYIENGYFDDTEFDVMSIVDNDVVNHCEVICEDDEDFKELLDLYHSGERDVSCETSYSYIEAVSDDETRMLVRY